MVAGFLSVINPRAINNIKAATPYVSIVPETNMPKTGTLIGSTNKYADITASAGQKVTFSEPLATMNSEPLATTKKQIQYVIIPHPDDETEAWSLIENSVHNYPIFVLLTKGESTGYCDPSLGPRALQANLGEISPSPNPYSGKWTANCEQARINSFNGFLDDMAGIDSALSKPPYKGAYEGAGNTSANIPPRREDGINNSTIFTSRTYEVWADGKSARVIFNLGDGDLKPEEVNWAIQTVRSNRDKHFPVLPEYAVIGASYYNASHSACSIYKHGDHRAIHVALWNTDQGVPGPQWTRTCHTDPDVVSTGGRTNQITDSTFQAMFGVSPSPNNPSTNPHAVRTGYAHKRYGWLVDQYWPTHDPAVHGLFTQKQSFWKKH